MLAGVSAHPSTYLIPREYFPRESASASDDSASSVELDTVPNFNAVAPAASGIASTGTKESVSYPTLEAQQENIEEPFQRFGGLPVEKQ